MISNIKRDIDSLIEANEYLKSQVRVMKEIIENDGGGSPRHCRAKRSRTTAEPVSILCSIT